MATKAMAAACSSTGSKIRGSIRPAPAVASKSSTSGRWISVAGALVMAGVFLQFLRHEVEHLLNDPALAGESQIFWPAVALVDDCVRSGVALIGSCRNADENQAIE